MADRQLDIRNPYPVRVGRWLRGNTHVHTTGSDGRMSPGDACAAYEEMGYDFLCITDHDVVTRTPDHRGELVRIPGVEISCAQAVAGAEEKAHHVVAFDYDGPVPAGLSLQETVDAVAAAGACPILGHPLWSRMSFENFVATKNLAALEVFNGTCRNCHGNADSTSYWPRQIVQYRKPPIWGVAADDAHGIEEFGMGWIMVAAENKKRAAIVEAFRRGAFYASTGPSFHSIRTDGAVLRAVFSSVHEVRVIAGHGGRLKVFNGHHLTRVEHPLTGQEGAVRIEIEDGAGKMAWTNPIVIY